MKDKNKKKEENKEIFDLEEALSNVNEFIRPGFHRFLLDKKVKNMNDFNKFYREYNL